MDTYLPFLSSENPKVAENSLATFHSCGPKTSPTYDIEAGLVWMCGCKLRKTAKFSLKNEGSKRRVSQKIRATNFISKIR